MQATRVRWAAACAWIAGLLFLAGLSCQTNPLYTLDLREEASSVLYGYAYLAFVVMVTLFYLIHQGHRATPKIWWSRLIIAHLTVLVLAIPAHTYQLRREMDDTLQTMVSHVTEIQIGPRRVFYQHPKLAIDFLEGVIKDPYRSDEDKRFAEGLMVELTGSASSCFGSDIRFQH